MRSVSGQKDQAITLLRALATEEGRRKNGLFFVENAELVRRAFEWATAPRSVIFSSKFAQSEEARDIAARAALAGAEVCVATEGLLAKSLEAKPTPECVAILQRKVTGLAEALAGELPLVQMVEHCENADNLGMLLRSCDAAGVTSVVLTSATTDPFARRVVRGSRGAVFTLPVCITAEPSIAIDKARRAGLQVIATSANANASYANVNYRVPTMIVVGNEHTGISQTVRELADEVVRISMLGRINSLNIAVAAAIVLYEAVRQRSELDV